MKRFLATTLLLVSLVQAFSQPIGTAMRTTNGFAFGTTTVGGRLLATNTIANGGTNKIDGTLHIGRTYGFPPAGQGDLLTLYQDTTNFGRLYGGTIYSQSKFAYTTNINHLNAGFTSLVQPGAGNTGSWTNNGYPGLMGYNTTIQPELGSTGTIRRVAGYAATIGGTAPSDNGSKFDESVGFWFDTTAVGNNLSNVIGAKLQGLAGGWNNTGLWLGIPQNTYPPLGNWGVWDETGYPSFFDGNMSIGATNTTNTLNVGAGTLATQSKALSVSGTLANSALTETGGEISITGAGSDANLVTAYQILFNAGYTGSGLSIGERIVNSSLGTGASGWTLGAGNYGEYVVSSGVTAGHKVGVAASVSGSSTMNLGVFGRSISANGSPLINIGVAGHGYNAIYNIGGFFGLVNSAPTITNSVALLADNGIYAGPILVANDNGTEVFRIDDGGNVGFGTPIPTAKVDVIGTINASTNISSQGEFHGNAIGVSNAVTLIAAGCIQITTNADGRTFTLSISGSGADVLTNNRSGATLIGLTLTGPTTNTAQSVPNWYGGLWGTNPATGKQWWLTNGNFLATGTIVGTNTATANTALTLNGAASGGAGQVIAYRTNNVDKFSVSTAGVLLAGDGTTALPSYSFVSRTDSGMNWTSPNLNLMAAGTIVSSFNSGSATFNGAIPVAFGSAGTTSPDSGIGRNGVGVIEVNNGTLGTLRDLKARAGTFSDTITATNGILWQGGAQLTNIYTATATLDFGNVATIGCADLTMTVAGAALGDVVDLGVPNASVVANSSYSAWVSAADTVTVRFCALISGDPASGVFRAEVHKWK